MTLELSDLDTIQDNALRRFDERISRALPADPAAIERELVRLESQAEQLYTLTAAMARREPDPTRTAELWAKLVRMCDVFSSRALQLAQQHALSTSSHDVILDIRSAAEELRALHTR
jgi:hypothetical protein